MRFKSAVLSKFGKRNVNVNKDTATGSEWRGETARDREQSEYLQANFAQPVL